MLEATQRSKLLEGLWDLPCDCRVPYADRDGKDMEQNGKEWKYKATSHYCPSSDDGSACHVSERHLAQLFAYALHDQTMESFTSFGCGALTFGGEHMHPY